MMNSACHLTRSIPLEAMAALTLQSNQKLTFDAYTFPPPTSLTSSYATCSSKESASSSLPNYKKGGLSRSRCVSSNLSALGGTASESSIERQVYKSRPNEGWGYFVDTPNA